MFARSPIPARSPCVLDMTELLRWARHHWHRLMNGRTQGDDERSYNYSSLLACGGKSPQTPRPAGKHRVVIPHLQSFKDEYERFSGTYVNNRIRTTKYTLLNFVPRNLFEQFHRYCGPFRGSQVSECSSSFYLILPPNPHFLIYQLNACNHTRHVRVRSRLERGCLRVTQFCTVGRTSSVCEGCCYLFHSHIGTRSVALPMPHP